MREFHWSRGKEYETRTAGLADSIGGPILAEPGHGDDRYSRNKRKVSNSFARRRGVTDQPVPFPDAVLTTGVTPRRFSSSTPGAKSVQIQLFLAFSTPGTLVALIVIGFAWPCMYRAKKQGETL